MTTLVETWGLTKRFGEVKAVVDLTLAVRAGEVVALLGPNGAGKTTTVRLLASILRPDEGRARVNGYDVVANAQEVRRSVGILTEFPALYLRMTALDYLVFFGQLYGLPVQATRRRASELLHQLGMGDAARKKLATFSKGMRQKVALIRALIHDPPVLFLDEPTSAMDPHSAKIVRDSIAGLRSAQRAILLCTHNLAEAETIADRLAIIRRGQLVGLGSAEELKRKLLGPPTLELRLAQPPDGAVSIIGGMVEVEATGPQWIRYRTDRPTDVNPQLLQRLAREGIKVVTLSEIQRSLEEVYLHLVEQDNAR